MAPGLQPNDQFYAVISDPFRLMDTPCPDTFRWWLQQSEGARKALTETPRMPLLSALVKLRSFLTNSDRIEPIVWSYGAAFDLPLLEVACERHGVIQCWSYRNTRCLRTVFATFGKPAIKPVTAGVEHNALDDAIFQAAQLRAIALEE